MSESDGGKMESNSIQKREEEKKVVTDEVTERRQSNRCKNQAVQTLTRKLTG